MKVSKVFDTSLIWIYPYILYGVVSIEQALKEFPVPAADVNYLKRLSGSN